MGDTATMTSQDSAADASATKKTKREKSAKKKAVAKKPPARKRTAKKKAAAKKSPARKRVAKKKAAAKKAPARKRVTKKKAAAETTPARPPVAPSTVTHLLTPQAPGGGIERRLQERHHIPGLIEVDIEVFGYQRDGREFGIGPTPDATKKIHSSGHTVNLSTSGMLAQVADKVTEGSNCLVRFIDAGSSVQPELRWGLVLRCAELESGKYEIAVHFDNPLEHLDVEALDAA